MTRKPTESPIDEIHRIRREISDRFGGDLVAIAEDAARRQAASNRPVWRPKTTNEATGLKAKRQSAIGKYAFAQFLKTNPVAVPVPINSGHRFERC